jgi:Fe2+ transport system protein FeoA
VSVIVSTIKSNSEGKWYFELKDEHIGRVETCKDLQEYEEKLNDMGQIYGADLQVIWEADENVTKRQIDEIKYEMMAIEAKLEEEQRERELGMEDEKEED